MGRFFSALLSAIIHPDTSFGSQATSDPNRSTLLAWQYLLVFRNHNRIKTEVVFLPGSWEGFAPLRLFARWIISVSRLSYPLSYREYFPPGCIAPSLPAGLLAYLVNNPRMLVLAFTCRFLAVGSGYSLWRSFFYREVAPGFPSPSLLFWSESNLLGRAWTQDPTYLALVPISRSLITQLRHSQSRIAQHTTIDRTPSLFIALLPSLKNNCISPALRTYIDWTAYLSL